MTITLCTEAAIIAELQHGLVEATGLNTTLQTLLDLQAVGTFVREESIERVRNRIRVVLSATKDLGEKVLGFVQVESLIATVQKIIVTCDGMLANLTPDPLVEMGMEPESLAEFVLA